MTSINQSKYLTKFFNKYSFIKNKKIFSYIKNYFV